MFVDIHRMYKKKQKTKRKKKKKKNDEPCEDSF